MTQEQVNALKDVYPYYVPFNRDVSGGAYGAKRSFANLKSPIKRAKGSGLDIVNPVESIVKNTEKIVKTALRNQIMQEVATIADTTEGMGAWLERVPADQVPTTISVENVIEKLKAKDVSDDVIGEFADAFGDTITEWKAINRPNQKANIITVMKDGKPQTYQVHDKGLYEALTNTATSQYAAGWLRMVGSLTRAFTMFTTGGNIFFSVGSNAPRDLQTGYVFSQVRQNPVKYLTEYFQAYADVITNSEDYQRYKATGGKHSAPLTANKNVLKGIMNTLYDSGNKSNIKRFFNKVMFPIKHPIQIFENIGDFIETAPRLAEFKREIQQTNDAQKAQYAAGEATVNFSRGGAWSKNLNKVAPFFNATIQGTDKTIRAFAQKPLQTIAKISVATIIPELISRWWNRDDEEYEKLSNHMKNSFYNFSLGNGKFFRFPKPQLLGVPASTVSRIFDSIENNSPDEFYGFVSYIANQIVPSIPVKDTPLIGTAIELQTNKDFKNTPIVPASMQRLTPSQQYDERTTWIAKQIGDLFNLSPKQIDHVIDSNLGVIGRLNQALGREEKDYSLGIKTQFTADAAYSNDIQNQFYDAAEMANIMASSFPNDKEYTYKDYAYRQMKTFVSGVNKLAKQMPSEQQRELKLKALDDLTPVKRTPNDSNDDLLQEVIRTLQNQLSVKDSQIQELNEGLKKALQLNENNQLLLRAEQEKNALPPVEKRLNLVERIFNRRKEG